MFYSDGDVENKVVLFHTFKMCTSIFSLQVTVMISTAARELEPPSQVLNCWNWRESSPPTCTYPGSEELRLPPT